MNYNLLMNFIRKENSLQRSFEQKHQATENHIEAIEFKNMPDEGDTLSAVLQITAGAGGTESCDWASMLMRMYMMWGEKYGYKIKELNYQEGEVAGIKPLHLNLKETILFGYLKGENGVHRLVRISPFDSNASAILRLRLFMCIH
jgi:peptide chain release factor 2